MARKKNEPRGTFIKIGGIPVDLNAGMIEAVTDPPPSFVSKHRFVETDLPRRIQAINWFANCGRPFTLDLTMPIRQVKNWSQTIKPCTSPRWDDAQLEAQNRLTLWLHLHDRARYRKWNGIVEEHKKKVIHPMLGMAGPDVALKP